jgi:hypothetical protein
MIRTLRAMRSIAYRSSERIVYLYADEYDEWYLCEASPADMREGAVRPPPLLAHVGFRERQAGVAVWNDHRIPIRR